MYHNFSAQVYARLDGCAFGPKLGWLVHFFFFLITRQLLVDTFSVNTQQTITLIF